jgi:hypothetical protein
MDVELIHNHIPSHTHPWRWEAAPTAPPTPPSVPRSCAGFKDMEEAEGDATKAGHRVTGVRE